MEIKNLSISYGENIVYKNFSLDINDGETLCIMGGSGSGKTTLLKAIAKIVPYDGEIDSIEKIGYVFQNPTLIPLITCEQNCLFVMNKDEFFRNEKMRCNALEENIENLSCNIEVENSKNISSNAEVENSKKTSSNAEVENSKNINCNAEVENSKNINSNAEVENSKKISSNIEAENSKKTSSNAEVENSKNINSNAEVENSKKISSNAEVENRNKISSKAKVEDKKKLSCFQLGYIKDSLNKWKGKRKDNKDVIIKMHKKVAEVFAILGITECLKKLPTQISGGQSSRVAIARALCYDAPILLLDEPFKGLDMAIKFQILTMFIKAAKNSKKTVIFVSHDLEDCLNFGDRLIVFEREDNINGIKIAGDFIIPHDKQSSVDKIIQDENIINNVDCAKVKGHSEKICGLKEKKLTQKIERVTEQVQAQLSEQVKEIGQAKMIEPLTENGRMEELGDEKKLNNTDRMNIIRDNVYKILLKNVIQ